jgi:pimeloyl-ACP methyl ester carboxylesterase
LEGLTLQVLAKDVANAVTALGARQVHVLGWAFGNRVARTTAQDHPDQVKTVTLLAAGGLVPPSEAVMTAFSRLGEPGLADSTRLRLRREALYAPMSDVVAIESVIRPGSWPEARAAQQSAVAAARVEEWWSGGDAPMLIVQGRQDVMAPAANGLSLQEQFPDRTSLVWIEDAGHMLLVEQPAAVAEQMVAFLREHQGS